MWPRAIKKHPVPCLETFLHIIRRNSTFIYIQTRFTRLLTFTFGTNNLRVLFLSSKMSKPIVVVIGATGGQGGSVVTSFLEDGFYQVRGITRNVNSAKAKALKARGVELVSADLDNIESLTIAFKVSLTASNSYSQYNTLRMRLSSMP